MIIKALRQLMESIMKHYLLADDKEYIDAIKEASEFASGYQLRRLFVTLLSMNTISKPDIVWNSIGVSYVMEFCTKKERR